MNLTQKGIFILLLTISSASFAQFGIKAGMNYGSNGKLESVTTDINNAVNKKGDESTGYHFGVFYKVNLPVIYLKPELIYTNTTSSFSSISLDGGLPSQGDLKVNKLDLPVLLGFKFLGPVSIFAGPSAQFLLSTKLDGSNSDNINEKFTVGTQFGIAAEIWRIGADIRYETGFSSNAVRFTGADDTSYNFDTRPNQLIFSVFYKFK